MRILSTLNEVDPLFAIGERMATPRAATPTQREIKHDWTCSMMSDLQHPKAPACIAFTDIDSGPTRGGSDGHGCYLTVCGRGFGVLADWGVKNHLYVGTHKVAKYHSLVHKVGGMQGLTVQVGARENGVALPVTATIGDAHIIDALDMMTGKPLTFTSVPGEILFVGVDKGVKDATAVVILTPPEPRKVKLRPDAAFDQHRQQYLNPTDRMRACMATLPGFRAMGWTDEQLVEHGYCEWVSKEQVQQ